MVHDINLYKKIVRFGCSEFPGFKASNFQSKIPISRSRSPNKSNSSSKSFGKKNKKSDSSPTNDDKIIDLKNSQQMKEKIQYFQQLDSFSLVTEEEGKFLFFFFSIICSNIYFLFLILGRTPYTPKTKKLRKADSPQKTQTISQALKNMSGGSQSKAVKGMVCPNCKLDFPEGFNFCGKCGGKTEEKLDVNIIYMLLISFFAGIGFGVMFFIPHSLFPEVIEIDELETGERREGIYYSFFVFFQKLGLALSLAMSNYILSLTGFISSNNENPVVIQPYSAKLALRIMVSFAPVVVLLISFIPLYFFPINKRLHEENLKLLREKKENFVDLSIEERN